MNEEVVTSVANREIADSSLVGNDQDSDSAASISRLRDNESSVKWLTVKPKFRILYSVPSASFETYLPPHKSVPDSSCVALALQSEQIETATHRWDIQGLGHWRVEAVRLSAPEDLEESPPLGR